MSGRFKNVKDMNRYFASKGTKLVIVKKNGVEVEHTQIPSLRDKVTWKCSTCNDNQISQFRSLLQNKKERFNCKGCGISKSRTNKTYETFVDDLQKEEWEMASDKLEYKNTKTSMKVICSNGHKRTTTYNRWSAGHRCAKCPKRKHSFDSVKKRYNEKGRVLLEDVYINNHTPMRCICPRCGELTRTSLDNLDTTLGCSNCARVKLTLEGVIDKFNEESCHLIFVGKAYDDIKHLIEVEEEECLEDIKTEVIFHSWPNIVHNSAYVVYTCSCGNSPCCTTWKAFNRGVRCMDCTKEKIKNMCMQIYGFDNPFNSPEIQEKIIMDRLRKFGVKYPMQLEANVKKSIETNKRNHGGIHNLRLPGQIEASKKAYEDKYKGKFGHVKEHQDKAQAATEKKYGNKNYLMSDTGRKQMLDKYGKEYHAQSDHFTEVMIELYGVPHAMQNPEIFSKAMKSAFSSKPYEYPSGNVVYIQGYEHYALDDLLEDGIEEEDIVIGNGVVECVKYEYGGKKRVYFPDIYVRSLDLLIEVKSTYTYEKDREKNDRKFEAACQRHNFELRIYGPKGDLIEKRRYD